MMNLNACRYQRAVSDSGLVFGEWWSAVFDLFLVAFAYGEFAIFRCGMRYG
ncbi:hypothetical protein L4D06_05115 [Enterovibrio makurazakiensis]|uniref:hypothetical protein n=1 Tax=Enterovibrio makurazakiensis TaxID=2910232 RepID=UPI003D201BC5